MPRSFLQQLGDTAEPLAWLDNRTDGWPGFLGAVEWCFDAPHLPGIQEQIRARLAAREETRALPGLFLQRLLFEILDASSRKEAKDRLLTRAGLLRVLDAARADLGEWAVTPAAHRLRERPGSSHPSWPACPDDGPASGRQIIESLGFGGRPMPTARGLNGRQSCYSE